MILNQNIWKNVIHPPWGRIKTIASRKCRPLPAWGVASAACGAQPATMQRKGAASSGEQKRLAYVVSVRTHKIGVVEIPKALIILDVLVLVDRSSSTDRSKKPAERLPTINKGG